ncbi:hypothetical protein C8Q77DRAFT_1125683 [Trametes polyzona]|nr:hypothetical protein C8Q77DRAFT_1125683 [Trametes polyzona]
MSWFGEVKPADVETRIAAARHMRKAVALVKSGEYERSVPFFLNALADYANTDAVVAWAYRFPDKALAVQLLETTREKARPQLQDALGLDCFEETSTSFGEFWDLYDTRPYMRTVGAIASLSHRIGDLNKAISASIETLRLCHGDNMGQRYLLSALLLKAQRYADALSFCQVWLDPQYDGQGRPHGGCVFAPPNPAPLTPEFVKRHSEPWSPGNLLLNAAYAAFRLYGDCELARQYLLLGTRANPHIFTKVLGRRPQPIAPFKRPRPPNGTDEAHDYRWLTQDLWMEPEVWAWVDANDDIKHLVTKTCSREGCGRREARPLDFKYCNGCKHAFYCSYACQKAHWRGSHRDVCKKANEVPAREAPRSPMAPEEIEAAEAAHMAEQRLPADDPSDMLDYLSGLDDDGSDLECDHLAY